MDDAVLVTGAAGALGHAVLAELRDRGLAVVALDRPSAALDELGAEDGVHPVPVDLADRSAVRAAFEQVDAVATPSALVALAGGFVPGQLADLDEDALETCGGPTWSRCCGAARRRRLGWPQPGAARS